MMELKIDGEGYVSFENATDNIYRRFIEAMYCVMIVTFKLHVARYSVTEKLHLFEVYDNVGKVKSFVIVTITDAGTIEIRSVNKNHVDYVKKALTIMNED